MHFKIKYPKLLLFLSTIVIAIFIFHQLSNYSPLHEFLLSLGNAGAFFAGIFYAYGFTAAPATAVLLVLAKEQNFILTLLIGGFGALISDIIIFSFVRSSLTDEIKGLEKEKLVLYIKKKEKTIFGHYYRHIFPALAGFLIASPLPTEVGVGMMASLKNLSLRKFILIAYVLHTLGILIILTIGNLI